MYPFEIQWKAPSHPSGGLERLVQLRTATTMMTSALAGVASYAWGSDLMTQEFAVYSALAAAGSVGGLTYAVFSRTINGIYKHQQEHLDHDARAQGAREIKFTYQGQDLSCVIRPEYQLEGKTFDFSARPLFDVMFSYHPTKLGLEFRVCTLGYEDEHALFFTKSAAACALAGFSFLKNVSLAGIDTGNMHVGVNMGYAGNDAAQRVDGFSALTSRIMDAAAQLSCEGNHDLILPGIP